MAAKTFSSDVLRSKFKGCMIGALMGDCLGKTFEFQKRIEKHVLNNYFNKLMNAESSVVKRYTDDSCMMMSVASSLVDKEKLDAPDMARKFVDEFFKDRRRGYGSNVKLVFRKLKESHFVDVFQPAKEQFGGEGSFGNGGAMRIAPIALFGNNKSEEYVMTAAEESARITHTHPNGVNGAILQCLAVNAALELDPSEELDPMHFVDGLLEKMDKIEKGTEKPYCESLKTVKDLLQNRKDISPQEIADILGNADDESALKSVPTAIYSFLRGMEPLVDYQSENPFVRTLYFAISVGGDTDTIACMACGIAGAYYGLELIPDILQKRCEALGKVSDLAEKLFDVTQKND